MTSKQYQGASRSYDEIKTVRVPCVGSPLFRGTSSSKDQRYVNGFFEVVKNAETGKSHYNFVKRPAFTQTNGIRPSGGNGVGRGVYSWNNKKFSVIGTKIYADSVDLGVTLTTTTGICGFAEVRPGVTTRYLGINDGVALYLVDTTNGVVVLNGVAITSSSVANPTVITTTTPHGLATGNKVYIAGHSGSTPTLNGTVYTVTVTGGSTFTIPVNVSGGGTGGTLGTFPTPNTSDLVYMDGYFFTAKTDATLWQCNLDDPLTWDTSKFLTSQQYNGIGVGLAHQNNIMMMFMDRATAMFYDNANAAGSVLSLYEQAVQQEGCVSQASIVSDEQYVVWVGNTNNGGYSVQMMTGIGQLKSISTSPLERILLAEGTSISSCTAYCLRTAGKFFYILNLTSANRTFVYDLVEDLWVEWELAAGGAAWPIVSAHQHANTLLVQHATNGWIYTLSPTVFQDDSTNFTVLWRTSRLDFDTNTRKYVRGVDIIGDVQSSTTNTSLQYSDDDYTTLSTARTIDMANTHTFGMNFGTFRRRSWQLSYTGANPWRFESLEFRLRLGQS